MLGLAQVAFHAKQFADAERGFREVVMTYPETDAAPEALYWAGVASYKATHNGAALSDTYRAFTQRYQDSAWAKKASVWNPEAQAKKTG
jgi:TolA-binding protein